MYTTIEKVNDAYYLNHEQQMLPEDVLRVLPQMDLPSANYLWLLFKAALDLDVNYYHSPNGIAPRVLNYEQDFYTHLGNVWEEYTKEVDQELSVNNDIIKRIPDELKPDLILNERYQDRQEIAVEVKRNVSATSIDKIYRDWEKLFKFTKGNYNRHSRRYEFIPGYAAYKIGVFFFMGGTMNDLFNKLRPDLQRLKDFKNTLKDWKHRIFCVCCSGDGILEYTTIDEVIKELKKRNNFNN